MSAGLNARGVAVAVAGYDLTPQVTIVQIIDQIRTACLFLWRRFGQRLMVYGHSAGGHLAACMVATDWKQLDPKAPADLVPAGYSISGLFDLKPLIATSMNADFKLNEAAAAQVSPLWWPVPRNRVFDAVVGGAEFVRIPAPEPRRRGRLAPARYRDALRGDARREPFHRGRSAERSGQRHDGALRCARGAAAPRWISRAAGLSPRRSARYTRSNRRRPPCSLCAAKQCRTIIAPNCSS